MSQRMKQKKGKVDPLKALRDARNNRSRAEQYTSETAEIYEPMDDSTHGWSEDDNFVEDDDNAGYTGNDEDEQSAYLSDYDESHSVPEMIKRKTAKDIRLSQ
ncbi:hypothetical protein BDF14DRAFT_150892 [Spinellus fusiger]|nr:hypothetical protein BDF14DRAFT_150892 [Spinellus fusiger]